MNGSRLPLIAASVALLALAGCVHVSPHAMPRDWPAPQSATPAALTGEFSGPLRDLSASAGIFFPPGELYASLRGGRFRPAALHLAADESGLTATLTGEEGRPVVGRVPVVWRDGAAVIERRHTGREGGDAATYRDTWRITTNAAGDLVIEHVSLSTGRLGIVPGFSYGSEWWRLARRRGTARRE